MPVEQDPAKDEDSSPDPDVVGPDELKFPGKNHPRKEVDSISQADGSADEAPEQPVGFDDSGTTTERASETKNPDV